MPITMITPKQQIDIYLQNRIDKKINALLRKLSYVGEQCILEARNNGDYKDQTGNLRSSVGYIIVKGGKVISMSSFNTVKDGENGAKKGVSFAKELADKYSSGTVLIVVAGMNYAAYVAAKGRNVLDSAKLIGNQLMDELKNSK